MQYTDACVYPLPTGDSSLRRMALEARELGFDSVVAAGAEGCASMGTVVVGGTIIQVREIREVQAAMRKIAPGTGLMMVSAGAYSFNRAVLQTGGIKVLRDIHASPKHSFDHILSRMAAERQVAVDLDLSLLIKERGYVRQKVLYRYADLVRLQERFGFPLTISSGARSILEMKSLRDMVALCRLFGMEKEKTLEALMSVSRLLHQEKPVEVVE